MDSNTLTGFFPAERSTARRLPEETLTASPPVNGAAKWYQFLLEQVNDGAGFLSLDSTILYCNLRLASLLGHPVPKLIGKKLGDLTSLSDQPIWDLLWQAGTKQLTRQTIHFQVESRPIISLLLSISPVPDQESTFGLIAVPQTALEPVEEMRLQEKKMEAVGRLAGGVAHHFNNLMTIVTGYSDILMNSLSPEEPRRLMAKKIKHAGERTAALTRQLLACGCQQLLHPRLLDLNLFLATLEQKYRPLLEPAINLITKKEDNLALIKADVQQLEQVLCTLIDNAQEAMPQGGKLVLETANVAMDAPPKGANEKIPPGPYVRLAVQDTGYGMDETTRLHLFEPFFTTKKTGTVGEGRGLGLASAYGIIKQSGGYWQVISEPGQGSTFSLFLPRHEIGLPKPSRPATPWQLPMGTETILLVEKEPAFRRLASYILRSCGYQLLEAATTSEAVNWSKSYAGPIDLLVANWQMPGMSALQLTNLLLASHPHLKKIYLAFDPEQAENPADVLFLPKPFSLGTLAQKVREILDQDREPPR